MQIIVAFNTFCVELMMIVFRKGMQKTLGFYVEYMVVQYTLCLELMDTLFALCMQKVIVLSNFLWNLCAHIIHFDRNCS